MATTSPRKRLIARLLILALLFGVVWLVRHYQQSAQTAPTVTALPSKPSGQHETPGVNAAPKYVLEVLNHVRRNGQAPDGYVGGREFQNREKHLPAKAPDGKKIRYSEWDVQPKVQGQNRGPERLVTGSDHSAWYTKDHYKTFLKID
jgi:guanyl-specific ribonuclease Sa